MLYLGIDAGGSKTDALLINSEGQVIGVGHSRGSANYHLVGLETALHRVKEAALLALGDHIPDMACFCMTAADMPHDFATLRAGLERMDFCPQFIVKTDVIGVFRAGSRFPYGVGVVCGTGFNAGGIDKNGWEFRLPALGAVTGDCAGGGDIGTQALGAAFRAWDGRGDPTQLQEALLTHLNTPDMESIAEMIVEGRLSHEDIAALAPLVFRVSEQGDPIARSIIRAQGEELGTAALAILRRLNLLDKDCDVALGGRVFYGEGRLLMETITQLIRAAAPSVSIKRLDVAPVIGAALLAADCHQAVDDSFIATLKKTLPDTLRLPDSVF